MKELVSALEEYVNTIEHGLKDDEFNLYRAGYIDGVKYAIEEIIYKWFQDINQGQGYQPVASNKNKVKQPPIFP